MMNRDMRRHPQQFGFKNHPVPGTNIPIIGAPKVKQVPIHAMVQFRDDIASGPRDQFMQGFAQAMGQFGVLSVSAFACLPGDDGGQPPAEIQPEVPVDAAPQPVEAGKP